MDAETREALIALRNMTAWLATDLYEIQPCDDRRENYHDRFDTGLGRLDALLNGERVAPTASGDDWAAKYYAEAQAEADREWAQPSAARPDAAPVPPGSYKRARGAIPWREGDEPSEVTMRRLRRVEEPPGAAPPVGILAETIEMLDRWHGAFAHGQQPQLEHDSAELLVRLRGQLAAAPPVDVAGLAAKLRDEVFAWEQERGSYVNLYDRLEIQLASALSERLQTVPPVDTDALTTAVVAAQNQVGVAYYGMRQIVKKTLERALASQSQAQGEGGEYEP